VLGKYVKETGQESIPADPSSKLNLFDGDFLVMSRAIATDSGRIGTLYLKADLKDKLQGRVRRYIDIVIMVMLISCLVAFLISYRLQPLISKPIIELARTARVVTEKKDYLIRATKTSEDEVGNLIDSFNKMLSVIQTRDAELQQANDMLEGYNQNLEKK